MCIALDFRSQISPNTSPTLVTTERRLADQQAVIEYEKTINLF